MLKLKEIFPKTKIIKNESNDYLILQILFEDRELLGSVCYWSTSGLKKSLIEIGLEETTGLIFKINVIVASVIYYQDAPGVGVHVDEKNGLPLFETDAWKPRVNPLGYHVEFYDPVYYVREENDAPVVIAMGKDLIALKIREIAEGNNIPVFEDPPLARSMFAQVSVDSVIPAAFYKAVAELVHRVYASKSPKNRVQ